jgi:NAD(P)-dependent dehydrogenase (short-subunit alcohol dehydrogenase family)
VQFVSPIESFPPEKWDSLIAINLSACFHTIRLALPGMRAKGQFSRGGGGSWPHPLFNTAHTFTIGVMY